VLVDICGALSIGEVQVSMGLFGLDTGTRLPLEVEN